MLVAATIAGLLLLLAVAGALYQWIGTRRDLRRFPAPGRLIDVGRARMHLDDRGAGSPTVVLESGISATSISWALVQGEIAQFTRVCSYDRAGLGWSDAAEGPRTPSKLAAELHRLLVAGDVPGPYVLVGHSFGGLVVRSFAGQYPSETAGLVLVDPLRPEDWCPSSETQKRMISRGVMLSRRGAALARVGVVRFCLALAMRGRRFVPRLAAKVSSGRGSSVTERLAGEVGKLPRSMWSMVAAHWSSPKSFETMARHIGSLAESAREMAGRPVAAGVPVTLITGAGTPEAARGWDTSRIAPAAEHVVAPRSGHWVQLDRPELVIEAVRAMVERVRSTGRESCSRWTRES
jgi:pimeloyl-ACP methyl ester carboxylesterase